MKKIKSVDDSPLKLAEKICVVIEEFNGFEGNPSWDECHVIHRMAHEILKLRVQIEDINKPRYTKKDRLVNNEKAR